MCAFKGPRFRVTVTKPEKRLRKRLEKRGVPFDAQKKIITKSGRCYKVDLFISPKLVVEVGYYGPDDMQEKEDLEASGFTVLWFRNTEIQQKLGAVCEQIEQERQRIIKQH
jgi:very-short-patch-repair endonuclease